MTKYFNILLLLLFLAAGAYAYTEIMSWKSKYDSVLKIVDGKDKAIRMNESVLNDLKNQNKELKIKLNEFKNVESVTKVITKTVIDTVVVEYDNSIVVGNDGSFTGNVDIDSTFYNLSCTFTEKSFTLNSLSIPNTQTIIVGDKKIRGWTGISKGTEFSVMVDNTNPYIQNVNIQNYTIKKEKKWYQTQGFAIGVGVLGGLLLD